jgi:hypothetical protein
LTVVAGVITPGYAGTGILGIPAAFVGGGVVLTVFPVGYVAIARHLENAGASTPSCHADGAGRDTGGG